jgi:hypothetical protein
MVESFERIRPYFESHSLSQLQSPAHADIQIPPIWPDERISKFVAEGRRG